MSVLHQGEYPSSRITKVEVDQQEILEHEEEDMHHGTNLEDAVFKQANIELEKILKEKDNFSPTCQLPKIDSGVDVDKFFGKLYAEGFTASHCLAARDSLVMLCYWLQKEMQIDCGKVLRGEASRMKFLKTLNAEHGEGWFENFKKSKWMNYIKEMRWLERGRQVERGDFKVMRAVGRGAFGVVSVAVTRTTGEVLALKEMKKVVVRHKAAKKAKSMVANERLILSMLGESPIYCCLGLRYAFETADSYVLAFQFCAGGDLDYRLSSLNKAKTNTDQAQGVPIDEAIFYAMELAVAINHMHKLLILHRDLKPLNVLLTTEGHCVLSDFGLACKLKSKTDLKRGRVGTPGYLPLEMLRKEKHGFPADWYSYGCTIYAMIRGLDPFHPALTFSEDRKKAALEKEPQCDAKFFSEVGSVRFTLPFCVASLSVLTCTHGNCVPTQGGKGLPSSLDGSRSAKATQL